jgi:Outer membrane protein beta-barrel domain
MTRCSPSLRILSLVFGLTLVLLSPLRAAAQVGIEGGINMATLKQNPDFAVAPTRTNGITGGLFASFGPDVVTGQIEILYSEKGARFATSGEPQLKLTYVEIPIAFRIQMARTPSRHFAIFLGTNFGINLTATQTASGVDSDVKDSIDMLDYGLIVGAGFQAGRLIGNVRYTHGVRDISEDTTNKLRTRTVTAMVGISFKH